jgi:hypothetical protein
MSRHPLEEMLDKVRAADAQAVADMNCYYGGGPTIENRLALADARAVTAIAAFANIVRYIVEKEKEPKP